MTAPVEAFNSVTAEAIAPPTQTWMPSDETAKGLPPTGIAWTTELADAGTAPTNTEAINAPPNTNDPTRNARPLLNPVPITHGPSGRQARVPARTCLTRFTYDGNGRPTQCRARRLHGCSPQ